MVAFPFGEVGPKNLFRRHADVLMYRMARFMAVSRVAFGPLIMLLRFLSRGVSRLLGAGKVSEEPMVSRRRVQFYLGEGASEGVLSKDEGRVAAILDRDEATQEKIMAYASGEMGNEIINVTAKGAEA